MHYFIVLLANSSFTRKEEIFYDEGGEAMEQVAQRGGGCPIGS